MELDKKSNMTPTATKVKEVWEKDGEILNLVGIKIGGHWLDDYLNTSIRLSLAGWRKKELAEKI